ncbi:HIT family protein [Actinoplanes flavus]|uniref:HIT domain-containing protein n=1 Tax=Actinoplanes flavus TaxID=2820290 RepID=A0ABS3UD58_9ACTN|nr:HIT domain-containing protein [Actinoplanes flavus]MBO3736716.1 HIT domain-containing protein [Actinoplanes flavus]
MTEQREEWTRWPHDWPAKKDGSGCVLCTFVGNEDPAWGVRVYTGRVANAYLATIGQIRGYCWVIWRDGHVCEPTDLDPADAQLFFADMLTVGRVLQELLEPAKLNFEILGNKVPHLHAHVVPRPVVDPNPGHALPWTYLNDGHPDLDDVHQLAAQLRVRLGESGGPASAGR